MMLQSCRHPYGQKKVMTKPINIKNDLVAAGLEEINEYGVRAFSLRRVAARCRVSCAAPYKHFESKEKLIYEIFATINRQWQEKQKKIIEKGLNLKDTLIEICMGHIAFLIQNPGFANLIMLNDQSLAKELRSIKTVSYTHLDVYKRQICVPSTVQWMRFSGRRNMHRFLLRCLV